MPRSATAEAKHLDEVFAALANSTRRAILVRLARGPATVNELAAPFEVGLPAISKHVKVLEHAGLIARGREAQFRPCSLEPETLAAVSGWADLQRQTWAASLDRLEQRLAPRTSDTKGSTT